jgi:hypothetical protein
MLRPKFMTTEKDSQKISSKTIQHLKAIAAASAELAGEGLYSGYNVAEKLVDERRLAAQKLSSEEEL